MSKPRGSVLVTGAAGFVGRFMIGELSTDYNVAGLGQEARPSWLPDEIDWYQADLLVPAALERVPGGWTSIVHLAGNTVPSAFSAESAVQQNVDMTRNLLDRVKTRCFLLVSSALVYAPSREPRTEESRIDPQGPYGRSKARCEELVRTYSERVDVRIARPFNHIGPGMQPALAIPSIIERVRSAGAKPGAIEMLGQDSIRDFVDVRDVVSAYRMLVELERPAFDTFNVCTGREVAISDVVKTALDVLGVDREINFAEASLSADDTSWLVGDSSRLQNLTGWQPTYTLEDSVRDMLDGA